MRMMALVVKIHVIFVRDMGVAIVKPKRQLWVTHHANEIHMIDHT